mgnify:CR=1 FL=1
MPKCSVCKRIELIKNHKNKYFVKELKTGYVVLCDYQYFYGYTIFISKTHTNELYKLKKPEKEIFLKEMAIVAESVIKAFNPKKLNYELLGNSDSHLHWHLIPRYGNDPNPKTAIWVIDQKIRCHKNTLPSPEKLKELKEKLIKYL